MGIQIIKFDNKNKSFEIYDSRLKAKECKSLDHIELCIAVDDYTITTIGANNGGTECDDFRIRTRYKSNISVAADRNMQNKHKNNRLFRHTKQAVASLFNKKC